MENGGATTGLALGPAELSVRSGSGRPRIALIGDRTVDREGLAAQLRRRYELSTFEAIDAALQRFKVERFDVSVLDMDFRDENALSVLRRLRRFQPSTKAIVVSAAPTAEAVIAAMRLGARGFVCRPPPRRGAPT